MKPVTIDLVRHGQTYINRYDRMQGWSDTPLTEKGIADAKKTGHFLAKTHYDRAYSSDTMRAMNTAKIILEANDHPDVALRTTMYFREEFYGYFEGDNPARTWFVIGKPHGFDSYHQIAEEKGFDTTKDMMHAADPFHDAEDATMFWGRIMRGFRQLREENPDGGHILLVSHGTTIRSIIDKFGKDQGFNGLVGPRNGSVSTLRLDDEGVHVLAYNVLPDDAQ